MATKNKERTKFNINLEEPKNFKLLLWNDDTTPVELVIFILNEIINLSMEASLHKTMEANNTGKAIIGIYPHSIASSLMEYAIECARENGAKDFNMSIEEE